ncbi:hypothetical protein BH11MYX2_BH11MYX2_00180 [soil metagenome]
MWALLLVVISACGDTRHAEPDAAPDIDAPMLDAPDIDSPAIDAPPDSPPHALDCTGTPQVVLDVGVDRTLDSFAVVGDVLYYSSQTFDGTTANGDIRAIDLLTQTSATTPVDVGQGPLITAVGNTVWVPGRTGVWKFQNGAQPVETVSGRTSIPQVVTADAAYVYWAERDPTASPSGDDSTVWRQLIAGGSPEALGTCDGPAGLVVTDTTLYCTEFQSGELKYGPKAGTLTSSTRFMGGTAYPALGAVKYGTDLFYFDLRPGNQVFQMSLATNVVDRTAVGTLQNRFWGLLVTDDYIYFSAYAPQRLVRATGQFETLAFPPMMPAKENPALWNGHLLFATEDYNRGGDRYVLGCVE